MVQRYSDEEIHTMAFGKVDIKPAPDAFDEQTYVHDLLMTGIMAEAKVMDEDGNLSDE